ncbi:galactokinase [Ferruginibacter sp. SUN106]|uniref:galactokinase n=1 Tax=Ferruginibacter sp. SUN106 TaxID=2978348 RepID=UPI003D35C1CD
MNSIATSVVNIFKNKFSAEPNIYYSPGRINLIGEHIDYNDGYVMPAAIDKGVYYAIAANGTDTINFFAADFNESLSITLKEVTKSDSWKNYVLSVVNEFVLLGKTVNGFDCVFGGDIPRGSGMSSSAAVEGGLAYALNDIFNYGMNRVELALLCQRAEHNYPGVNCGIMDMYASINGKRDHVILLDCKNITHEYFPLKLDGYKIVLLNTKVHHTLASGEYNVRRKRCEAGMVVLKKELNIQSFREIKSAADVELHKDKMAPEVYNCCKFVVEEIARTQKAAALLQQNDVKAFGQLMYAGHEGLSKLYDVSCPQSDFLVALAKDNDNVIGARQMGGGFGGCTINIIKDEAIDDFIATTTAAYQKEFDILLEAYVMQLSNGTEKISA